MTTRSTAIEGDQPDAKRRRSLIRHWPWLFLATAALVFAIKFIPGFFLSTMDTETIVLPVFYHDIVEAHHSSGYWGWGGFSALFPDITVFFWLNLFSGNGRLSLILMQACFYTGWLAATVALVMVLKRPNKLALISILLVLWVGLFFNFGLPNDWGLNVGRSLLVPIYHSGTGVMSLICLVLLISQISNGWGIGFWWLFVMTFLGGASDLLFDVVFVGPAVAAMSLCAIAFRSDWKWYLTLGGNLVVAAVAAYYLIPYIFPPALATDCYLQFGSDRIQASYESITAEIFRPEHHFFFFVMVLEVLTVLGGIGGLLFYCFSARRKYVSVTVFTLMVFCSCSVLFNWGSVMVLGNYFDMNANRYVTVALGIPLFLFAFGLHAIILWRPWLEKILAVATSAFTLTVAFIPQQSTINYDGTTADIPYLKKLMKERHIQSCLSNYWSSNIVTFLSNNEVPVRSLTNDGRIYKWFNNLEWFGKGHPIKEWPHFRMIYCPDHGYSEVFGKPDEILFTPGKTEIWLYSDARSIRYSEYFDVLSNALLDDGRTLHLNPAALPGGPKIDGNARIAVDGDGEGWLEFGPYLVLEPARYRVTFRYTFSTLPTTNRAPTYDILVHTGEAEESINGTPLPCPNTNPQVFTNDFTVTGSNRQYEMRLFYHGSGTIRVESLEVTYLGN